MYKGFWSTCSWPVLALSPMDGVTDAAFRYITDIHGKPSILFTEFVPVEGLQHGAVKLMSAFIYHTTKTPTVAQIYGTDLEGFYRAAFIVAELGFNGIDINMGCPDKSVSKRGAGAGLILQPAHAQKIIRATQQGVADWAAGKTLEEAGVHEDIRAYISQEQKHLNRTIKRQLIPVSVKTRIGFDSYVTEEWVKNLMEAEPVNISLHGRTLRQMYTGEANWEEIGKAAAVVKGSGITLLGNGDVKTKEEALNKIQTYGVDGVLIGRATFGNPWLFQGIQPTPVQRLKVAIEHCQAFMDLTSDHYFVILRKHLAWYCRDFEGAAEVRGELMRVTTVEDVTRILTPIIQQLEA